MENPDELNTLDVISLFWIFEETCSAMIYLMTGSFSRFKQTKYFDKLIKDRKD